MDRRTALLADVNLHATRGLEIGPLTAALVSKEEGRVEYIDHLSTEELRKNMLKSLRSMSTKSPSLTMCSKKASYPGI